MVAPELVKARLPAIACSVNNNALEGIWIILKVTAGMFEWATTVPSFEFVESEFASRRTFVIEALFLPLKDHHKPTPVLFVGPGGQFCLVMLWTDIAYVLRRWSLEG